MKWDFYINGQGRCVGTVISGTHAAPELIKAFVDELNIVRSLVRGDIHHEGRAWLASAVEWQSIVWDDMPEVQDLEDEELGALYYDRASELPNLLMESLDNLAPEGYRFGAHEGDGADFGWWRIDPLDLHSAEECHRKADQKPPSIGDILKGVLGAYTDGMLIQFDDGCFQLITLVPEMEPEIICQHEEWNQFLTLVAEYGPQEELLHLKGMNDG